MSMVSHWSLSDNMSSQVSRTLLSILDLNHAVIRIAPSCSLISEFSCPFTNLLGIVPSATITIGITVIFVFYSFSNPFQSLVTYLSFRFLLFLLCGALFGMFFFFFFFLTITRYGRLTEIRWSICISKFQRSLCVSFSRTDSGLSIYHLFVWSNLNFLHNSQWINFFTQTSLVFYSFSANLQHSLIMWVIISSLSQYKLRLNKSWRQHPTKHQLYSNLPPITKTIQARRTRHAGHCWRSRDEIISDVLLWIPTYG